MIKGAREVSRITLMTHQELDEKVMETLTAMGLKSVTFENARCVRQQINNKKLRFLGPKIDLMDVPTDIYRLTVPQDMAERVLCGLVKNLNLKTPGRGAVYAQEVMELSTRQMPEITTCDVVPQQLLHDLRLITCIQSKSNTGDNLAVTALKLGAGVPVVGLGMGSGIRDRLGLLRITISPEKEMIYLMVPNQDANGLQNLLIDEGHINRAGGGFLYQTPIKAGMVDPLIRIGHQEHAASIEQIIAAIDDIKKSTSWRKRFFDVKEYTTEPGKNTHYELSYFCQADYGEELMHIAMQAGAKGGTTTKTRAISLVGETEGQSISYEHGFICLEAGLAPQVLEALNTKGRELAGEEFVLQYVEASSVFSHKPN
jgi:nitrogen regulatory protein PII